MIFPPKNRLYPFHQDSISHSAFAERHTGDNDDFVSFLGQLAFQTMLLASFMAAGRVFNFSIKTGLQPNDKRSWLATFSFGVMADDALNRPVSSNHSGGEAVIS